MKARIIVTPKKEVFDPQGNAVRNALEQMGYEGVREVRVGRFIEVELEGEPAVMEAKLNEACLRFLSNPVIEEYALVVSQGD